MTNSFKYFFTCIVAVLLSSLFSPAHAASLSNSGFEDAGTIVGGPKSFGIWGGDNSAIVSVQNGITPFQGSSMLNFINTWFYNSSTSSSDIRQFVDMSSYSNEINNGLVSVSTSAYFNRVAGNSQTDTQFMISIHAYSGTIASWTNLDNIVSEYLYTDSSPATWEVASTEMVLPESTDFISIDISAYENVYNDTSGVELDGHYADNVSMRISVAPEPISYTLFIAGGATLGFRRFRNKFRK